jgi:hypothetical protein
MRELWVLLGGALVSVDSLASAQVMHGRTSQGAPNEGLTGTNDEIVVTGRTNNDRYRLPPQFRTEPTEQFDHWRDRLSGNCQHVGLRGCPIQPNPVITFRSDGTV